MPTKDGYKGSDSFAGLPSSPYRNSSSHNSVAPPPPTYEQSMEPPRKRRAEGAPDTDSDNDFQVRGDGSLKAWKAAYNKAVKYGRDKKNSYLQLKGQILEKDKKLNKADAILHERNGFVIQLQTQVTDLKLRVNDCEKTIHELEEELQEVKSKNKQSEQKHLNETMARSSTERRPRIPTLVPDDNPIVRKHPNYTHPNAPRDDKNINYRYFVQTRDYLPGTGKVGPSRYGSNGRWDLGLCQVHFQTPSICDHGDLCEYRHEVLEENERLYISRLVPNGPDFLQHSDAFLAAKHTAA